LASREEDAKDHNLPKLVWFGLMHLGKERLEVAKATGWPELLRYLARSSAREAEMVDAVIELASNHPAKSEHLLKGLMEGFKGLRKAPMPSSWEEHSVELGKRHPKMTRELSALFGDGRALDSLKATALNEKEDLPVRKRALEALIESDAKGLRQICEKLFWTTGLCETAVRGLTRFEDEKVGESLAKNYRKLRRKEDKAAVINGLVSRPTWTRILLQKLAEGTIPRKAVTPYHARQVLEMKDEKLTEQLRKHWGELRQSDKVLKKKIADFEKALTPGVRAKGDKSQGRVLFETLCASCHQLYGTGGKLGPDLTGSGRADLGYLLENIVAPNSVVPAEYQMSIITLKDGRVLSGVVSSSDKQSMILKTLTDEIVIEKKSVVKSTRLPDSMMPPGLLDTLSPEQTRDLISYLMHPQQVALPDERR
jgi:putative heme-binding domain-containing protein